MAFSVRAQRLVEVGKGFSSTSVNTTVFRNNSIVTHGNTQYISYYDAEGWLMLGKRRLGTGEWILHRTQYKGHVKDAHNIISMMVDGDGYLHLSFDHHGHKLNYCRSIAPDTLVLGDKEPMIGNEEEDVTYPEFHLLAGCGVKPGMWKPTMTYATPVLLTEVEPGIRPTDRSMSFLSAWAMPNMPAVFLRMPN